MPSQLNAISAIARLSGGPIRSKKLFVQRDFEHRDPHQPPQGAQAWGNWQWPWGVVTMMTMMTMMTDVYIVCIYVYIYICVYTFIYYDMLHSFTMAWFSTKNDLDFCHRNQDLSPSAAAFSNLKTPSCGGFNGMVTMALGGSHIFHFFPIVLE